MWTLAVLEESFLSTVSECIYRSVLLLSFSCFKRWEISEPWWAKSGLLLGHPQPPSHVGFGWDSALSRCVGWLDAVPEKPPLDAHALGVRGRVRGLGKRKETRLQA